MDSAHSDFALNPRGFLRRFKQHLCCRGFISVCQRCALNVTSYYVPTKCSQQNHDDITDEFCPSVINIFITCIKSDVSAVLRMFDHRWPLSRRCTVECSVQNKSPLWKLNTTVCCYVTALGGKGFRDGK